VTNDPEVLVAFLKEARDIRNDLWRQDPIDGTRAYRDIEQSAADFGSEEPGRRIYEMANLWLLVAAELVRGIGVLVEERNSWSAMFPLMRSTIENCGAILWLTDESPTNVRAARAAVALIDSLERNVDVLAKFEKDSPEYATAKARRDETVAIIENEFGTVQRSPWRVGSTRMPRPSSFIDPIAKRRNEPGVWEGMYAYLSAMGIHPSAGLGSLMSQPGPKQAQISISDVLLGKFLRSTVDPLMLALGTVSGSMGWDRPTFDDYHQRYVEVLSE
jgi:hypothetical protein